MKIPLIGYKNMRLYLVIDKTYVSTSPIISLGCDCHPAYVLDALYIRKQSFPFDWLNTTPSFAMDYVNINIKDCFKNFLMDLKVNERGHVVSNIYTESEFMHYPDLIENRETISMLFRRANRFMNYYNKNKCLFLFSIASKALNNDKDISGFLDSINTFHQMANGNHRLLIYIRYDETFQENHSNCEYIIRRISEFSNTKITRYILHKNKFGTWGDKRSYVKLLRALDADICMGPPKIYLKINNFSLLKHKEWYKRIKYR